MPNTEKKYFTMYDIAPILGIPLPGPGRTTVDVECPCCKGKRKTLHIDFEKGMFRCAKCSEAGKTALTLYMRYTGLDTYSALKELRTQTSVGDMESMTRAKQTIQKNEELPLAPIKERDAVYRALLDNLTLTAEHKNNLKGRGLTDDEIQQLGYRSAPEYPTTLEVAKKLLRQGYRLEGIPGMCKSAAGRWQVYTPGTGILIPALDCEGRIQGLQIRLDTVTEGKFRWVSSLGRRDGTKAMSWSHVSGDNRATIALLVEGLMKGDITHILSGMTVICIPGTSAQGSLSEALAGLPSLQHIIVCFDMDAIENEHVMKDLQKLLQLLSGYADKLTYEVAMWPEDKGIDDYLWHHYYRFERSDEKKKEIITRIQTRVASRKS